MPIKKCVENKFIQMLVRPRGILQSVSLHLNNKIHYNCRRAAAITTVFIMASLLSILAACLLTVAVVEVIIVVWKNKLLFAIIFRTTFLWGKSFRKKSLKIPFRNQKSPTPQVEIPFKNEKILLLEYLSKGIHDKGGPCPYSGTGYWHFFMIQRFKSYWAKGHP